MVYIPLYLVRVYLPEAVGYAVYCKGRSDNFFITTYESCFTLWIKQLNWNCIPFFQR